jgi:predicted aminopeptidase
VPAYSTLGWFDDPVLSTFIQYPEAELARLMFHELAHQLLYVKDDTRFNESFAATVEQAGVTRWLEQSGNEGKRAGYARLQAMRGEFVALLLKYRGLLEQYYGQNLPPEQMRLGKAQRFAELDEEYGRLKASWGGFAGFDRWFAGKPNNATLASVALYTELVPAFTALLEREGGDLPRFYAAVKALAKLPKEERDARLLSLTGN